MKTRQPPIVTVGIPFYNSEEYLEAAINSVFNQTISNWTLVLLNDGSTDRSLEIASRYSIDDRVEIISDGLNLNLGARLNQLATHSKTKYLARMDSDDIMHPRRLEEQIRILESIPEIDVLGTNAYSIDAFNKIQGIRCAVKNDVIIADAKEFIHPTIIAKTEWFRDNPYDPVIKRFQDAELWLRTRDKYNFKILLEPLFYYREIADGYSMKYSQGLHDIGYVIKKHGINTTFLSFITQYIFKSLIYLIAHAFGLEAFLVRRRNKGKTASGVTISVMNDKL